ncbi:MAG: PKD domain-containing protein [Candidatus Bipolaricaulia bacterium]
MRIVLILLSLVVLLGGCARHKPPKTENLPPRAVAALTLSGKGRLLVKFSSGEAPLTVRFDGSRSRDEDGEIVKFFWDFGDGAISEEESPSHTYSAPGEYVVTLTVTDDRGATDQDTLRVLVFSQGEPRPPAEPQLDGVISEGEYRYSYHDKTTGVALYWTISGELIYLGLVGPISGWLGLGLAITAPPSGMEGLDIILGSIIDGKPPTPSLGGKLVVHDDYADAPFRHAMDTQLGGRDDILAAEGSENEDGTTIELVRKMNTEDKFDIPIINGWMVVALASSPSGDLGRQHDRQTIFKINFFTGETEPLEVERRST